MHTQIRFPYGTTVKIAVDGSYANVWVYPSPPDWKNTIGKIGVSGGLQKILVKTCSLACAYTFWPKQLIANAESTRHTNTN